MVGFFHISFLLKTGIYDLKLIMVFFKVISAESVEEHRLSKHLKMFSFS